VYGAERDEKVFAMKVIVIGATGTIGVEVAKALSGNKHEVVRASRNSDVKVDLDDPASIRAMFEKVRDAHAVVSCAGSAAFKPLADLTDADYELGIRSKLMGQVSVARMAKDYLRWRLDHLNHGRTRDAPDGEKRIRLDGQRRSRGLCSCRGARVAAKAPH
jgi:NAD(P)-dependent dehydrogenase (short-subunit alcohol dehydrogenase family)